MAGIIIDGNFPNGLDLDNPATNPVTIVGTIEVGTSGQFGALQGETVAAWDVTNQGTILGGEVNGIDLFLGGTVVNDKSALVSGVFAIEIDGAAGVVVNAGTLTGDATGTGVDLTQGGNITNQLGGLIESGDDGVTAQGPAAVTNSGIIFAGTRGAAVDLLAGGSVFNSAGGTLAGAWGISIQGGTPGSVTNDGVVAGETEAGVFLTGGEVINQAAGTISGTWGVVMQGATTNSVVNGGVVIGGAQSGVFLTGGTVIDLAGGTISGNWGIADTTAAATVITAGTITGNNGTAVTFASGFANRLVDDPGAVFNGLVDGGNAAGGTVVSTLELAAGAQGTLDGLGINFVDFGNVLVDPGASWVLANLDSLAAGATLTDEGALLLDNAVLIANGAVTIGASDAASVEVTGGAIWSGHSALVDGEAGNGSVLVSNLGTLEVATAVLGASAGGTGSLSVTGAGSGFATTASLTVGQGGGGELTVANQAVAEVGGGIDIAAAAGATGDVTVTGTLSVLANTGSFVVGDSGLGALVIDAGGTVTTSAGAVIANAASAASSFVNLSGLGSNWQIAGGLTVGNAGFGSLSISQGATVTAASVVEAASAGGDGVITVAGTGSALTLSGSLTVGSQAAGEVSVLGGSTLTALDVTIGNASAASSGNVDVEGAGSTLHVLDDGILNIGVAGGGSGVLTIGRNATLSFDGTIVEAGHASFNNNGGVIDPDAVQFTSSANSGAGLNEYNLYVDNTGAVQIDGGTGTWDAPMLLTGSSVVDATNNINNGSLGQWQLSGDGTLVVNANLVDAGQVIVFEDATDTLVIGQQVNGGAAGVAGQTPTIAAGAENLLQAGGFQAEIWGYQAGDQILFDNLAVVSDQIVNGNTLELLGAGNTDLGELTFFTKAGNKPLGTADMLAAAQQMACFAAGTLIETADGPRPVETLAVGDTVVALLGGAGRIVWVGSRAVDCTRHPRPEAVWPVRIAAGAFGPGLPERDLFVSPDHALYVDSVLIPAKHLLNGTTIRQLQRRHVVYHHVELEQHDVVLAEGLPAETYLDTGDRAKFNDGTLIQLVPDLGSQPLQVWESHGAAPLVVTGPALDAVRRALARIASEINSSNLSMVA